MDSDGIWRQLSKEEIEKLPKPTGWPGYNGSEPETEGGTPDSDMNYHG